jgi:hypothetical protein
MDRDPAMMPHPRRRRSQKKRFHAKDAKDAKDAKGAERTSLALALRAFPSLRAFA